jgi:hypothetical protein
MIEHLLAQKATVCCNVAVYVCCLLCCQAASHLLAETAPALQECFTVKHTAARVGHMHVSMLTLLDCAISYVESPCLIRSLRLLQWLFPILNGFDASCMFPFCHIRTSV